MDRSHATQHQRYQRRRKTTPCCCSAERSYRVLFRQELLFVTEFRGVSSELSRAGAFEEGVQIRPLLYGQRHVLPSFAYQLPCDLEVPPSQEVHPVREGPQTELWGPLSTREDHRRQTAYSVGHQSSPPLSCQAPPRILTGMSTTKGVICDIRHATAHRQIVCIRYPQVMFWPATCLVRNLLPTAAVSSQKTND